MNRFQQGKIYKITSPQTEEIYIGSTTERTLARRLTHHVTDYHRWKAGDARCRPTRACQIIDNPDYNIVLLELFPCASKDELNAREQYWLDLHRDVCVNKCRAHNGGVPRNTPFLCDCGGKYVRRNLKDHASAKIHQDHLATREKLTAQLNAIYGAEDWTNATVAEMQECLVH